jgi:hypothetical protein
MFQRGEIEQALHHFKQLFAKKPGNIFLLDKNSYFINSFFRSL